VLFYLLASHFNRADDHFGLRKAAEVFRGRFNSRRGRKKFRTRGIREATDLSKFLLAVRVVGYSFIQCSDFSFSRACFRKFSRLLVLAR
jgi:hypothetical protein